MEMIKLAGNAIVMFKKEIIIIILRLKKRD